MLSEICRRGFAYRLAIRFVISPPCHCNFRKIEPLRFADYGLVFVARGEFLLFFFGKRKIKNIDIFFDSVFVYGLGITPTLFPYDSEVAPIRAFFRIFRQYERRLFPQAFRLPALAREAHMPDKRTHDSLLYRSRSVTHKTRRRQSPHIR